MDPKFIMWIAVIAVTAIIAVAAEYQSYRYDEGLVFGAEDSAE